MQFIDELSTRGRLGRRGFWLRHLVLLPVALFLCIATSQLLAAPIGLLAALATTVFLISVWGRRLHDRGHSAWWLLLAALPVLGPLGLIVECGLRGTRAAGDRHGPAPGQRPAYLKVGSTPAGPVGAGKVAP